MSAKSTTPAAKTETTLKPKCADHPAVAEANGKYRALIERTNTARSELSSARASMTSDRTRSEDRAIALLEDPNSAPTPSLALRVAELAAEVESLESAEAKARAVIAEARQAASDEACQREKDEHAALANNVVDKWTEFMQAIEAEQEFVRDFGARGYAISSSMAIRWGGEFMNNLRHVGKYLAQYGWKGTKPPYQSTFSNPLAEANAARRKIMEGNS